MNIISESLRKLMPVMVGIRVVSTLDRRPGLHKHWVASFPITNFYSPLQCSTQASAFQPATKKVVDEQRSV